MNVWFVSTLHNIKFKTCEYLPVIKLKIKLIVR